MCINVAQGVFKRPWPSWRGASTSPICHVFRPNIADLRTPALYASYNNNARGRFDLGGSTMWQTLARRFARVLAGAAVAVILPAHAQGNGTFVVGQLVERGGAQADYARDFMAGAKVAFDAANQGGGIKGRRPSKKDKLRAAAAAAKQQPAD